MTSTHDRIRHAAARNAELLAGLHETETAPSQLYQQIQYIRDLHAQLEDAERRVQRLQRDTARELQDHKRYNESTFRRFAHRASGQGARFDARAAKEEETYFRAIQAQRSAEDEVGYARQLLSEAEATKAAYEGAAARHSALQADLDALYGSIFAGATPEFPVEDAFENACATADAALQGRCQTLERERHVLALIRKACGRLLDAKRLLMQARDMSAVSLWGNAAFAGAETRNALEQVQSCLQQVRMLVHQNAQMEGRRDIQALGDVNLQVGSIWSDVVFNNGFTDMEMHRRIQQAEAQVDRALGKGAQLMKDQQAKEKTLLADVNYASGELRERRAELQRSRQEAFRAVVGGEEVEVQPMAGIGGEDEAPPAYSRVA